jgi:hypothetical protein
LSRGGEGKYSQRSAHDEVVWGGNENEKIEFKSISVVENKIVHHLKNTRELSLWNEIFRAFKLS